MKHPLINNWMQLIRRKMLIILLLVGLAAFYAVAVKEHQIRAAMRDQPVLLTQGCEEKLARYDLAASETYQSPYALAGKLNSQEIRLGYSAQDVRAIQRGCNIIDDLQGEEAGTKIERWNSMDFVRGKQTSCDHCHQSIGDKQDPQGKPLVGSLSLGASWVMADMYDKFTGLLLPFELRQMQCYINSSNGYKPNISDDLIRDVNAYSRFLSAALDLKIGQRYPQQGINEIAVSDTLKRGDDYVRGKQIYLQKCSHCHGVQGKGKVVNDKVIFPAVAGPDAFNLQSRNNFSFVSTILPGFICSNMPKGNEGSLTDQECRDVAFFISNLPRPAGDKDGPVAAAWQQLMMQTLPGLVELVESWNVNREHTL